MGLATSPGLYVTPEKSFFRALYVVLNEAHLLVIWTWTPKPSRVVGGRPTRRGQRRRVALPPSFLTLKLTL